MNIELEQTVLGVIINHNDLIQKYELTSDLFLHESHQKIFDKIESLNKIDIKGSKSTLGDVFGTILEGRDYLQTLLICASNSFDFKSEVKNLKENKAKFDLGCVSDEIKGLIKDPTKNSNEIKQEIIESLEEVFVDSSNNKSCKIGEAARIAFTKETKNILKTNYNSIDEITGGFDHGSLIVLAGRPAMGKAQPLDSKVLTCDGWKNMGGIKIGDKLASIDGRESKVIAIHKQGVKEIFRVYFRDGRSVECCAEHLWKVYCKFWKFPRVIRTSDLIDLLQKKRYQKRLWIDNFNGDFGANTELPIDPWILGVLLGDGGLSSGSITFTNKDPEMIEKLQSRLGNKFSLRKSSKNKDGCISYRIRQNDSPFQKGIAGTRPNQLKEKMKELGLFGCLSYDKFIPQQYLDSSKINRLELLRGLLDTDGFVEKWGTIRYSTSSKKLAEQIIYLARSLGATTNLSTKNPFFSLNGIKKQGRSNYIITITHPNESDFLTLSRKKNRTVINKTSHKRNFITNIEMVEKKEAQCISVSHDSQLYVTNDFIVTHNSCLALNIAMKVAKESPVLFISLEMSKEQISKRAVANLASIHLSKLRHNNLSSQHEVEAFQKAIMELDELDIEMKGDGGITLTRLRYDIKRFSQKGKLVVIDYIQLIKHKSKGNTVDRITEITNELKAMAMEFGVVIIGLSQLSRAVESRDDKRPMLSDLRDSGSIEQDADVVMFTFRPEYYLSKEEPRDPNKLSQWENECQRLKGVAYAIIAKVRDGQTGDAKLHFQGEFQRFTEINH